VHPLRSSSRIAPRRGIRLSGEAVRLAPTSLWDQRGLDSARCLGSPGHMTDDNSGQHHRRSTIERIKELVARMKAEKGQVSSGERVRPSCRRHHKSTDGLALPVMDELGRLLNEREGTASAGDPSSRGRQSGHFQSVHGRDTFITGLRSDLFLSGEKIHCRRSRLNCTKVYRYASAAYRLGSGA
jgi:hypothetical protein